MPMQPDRYAVITYAGFKYCVNRHMNEYQIFEERTSMNKLKLEQIINQSLLEDSLDAIGKQYRGEDMAQKTRAQVLSLIKQNLNKGRKAAETMLLEDGGGRLCARRLSHLMDSIIMALVSFAQTHLYPRTNPTQGENIALIAVGGYGRGTLAPGSDIDLHFLLPYKQTPWGEQIMEYLLYMLWDCGLKVGHAARTVEEAIRMAKSDMSERTCLLDTRFLQGDKQLFNHFMQRFAQEVIAIEPHEFIRAKLVERDQRHLKIGQSRYLVEPNIKEGKGGQRDLHMLLWITHYFYHARTPADLVNAGILSRREADSVKKADDFLWAVRCHMHFLNQGKAQERLSFDIQRDIACRLGYTQHPGQKDVERFMKHYFLVAKQVGDLTRIICAALEEAHAKPVPGIDRLFIEFETGRHEIKESHDFIIDNQRINIADERVFARNPVQLLRIFQLADQYGLQLHPHALRQISRSLKLVDAQLRDDKTANKLFMDILTSRRDPAALLRQMNETGLLGKFIPDFGKIVALMQFSMYHHYTVDEHLLRCIENLSRLERGENARDHPLATSLVPQMDNLRPVLYTALFLHDIAKGRPEDHALAGERIARQLSPRLGLDAAQTDLVAWLVREHLTMSMVAQSRDLNDRKTIMDFATTIQTMERLNLLLLLTICDIKAVGPSVWNGWKGELLRTLYYATELVLSGGNSQLPREQEIHQAKQMLRQELGSWSESERLSYESLHHSNYWLSVSREDQISHARFIMEADRTDKNLAIMTKFHDFEAITELTILARDHPRLLSLVTGACAATGANIVGAQIFTMRDGRALDIILISRAFEKEEDEQRRAKRISALIEEALAGHGCFPTTNGAAQERQRRATRAFATTLAPFVEINNNLSEKFSVIEIEGLDQQGLLSQITASISDLSLDIASAHITTFGEKIRDSFYVTDLAGNKIEDQRQIRSITTRLSKLLQP